MIKKTSISIIAILVLVTAATITASAETVTHTDSTGDVINSDYEEVNRPNLDIERVTAVKDGKQVELKLKLVDGGTIQKSTLSYMFGYNIILVTTHDLYTALYTGLDLSSLSPEDIEGATDDELELYESLACFVVNEGGDNVDVISYDGEGENELSIKFNLLNSNEEIIALSAETAEQTTSQEFYDEYTGEDVSVDVQEVYNATTGTPVSFQGSLEDGDPSDYNWVWYFEETNTVLKGENPSHTFKIPDVYEGTVYAYDDDGNYGVGFFSVNVTGKTIDDGDDNGSPGFEVIILFAAIAVALILLRKRR